MVPALCPCPQLSAYLCSTLLGNGEAASAPETQIWCFHPECKRWGPGWDRSVSSLGSGTHRVLVLSVLVLQQSHRKCKMQASSPV